jgi:L-rhamnose isomerase
MSYAATRGINALLDNGHYHPTELVSDKIPSLLAFFDKVALHVTRGVRWDSDHVVLFEDELKEIAKEIVRNNATARVLIGLDYFDASINRIGAWVTGARNMQKALLYAFLMPHGDLAKLQNAGNFSRLMNLHEELKTLPFGLVWDEYLARQNIAGSDWFDIVEKYEKDVLSKR